jgi:hypothetical protein
LARSSRPGALLPPGFRWIAVRPGAGPSPRRRRRPLGPTPRYTTIPRWGLIDPATMHLPAPPPTKREGPSLRAIRATIVATLAALAFAVLTHIGRYVLLMINRDKLLDTALAAVGTWVPVAAAVAVIFIVVAMAFVSTEWLIARRARAYAHYGQPDPRGPFALRAGCLVPVMNLFGTLVYVVELASVEDRYLHVRRLIWTWWSFFLLSTAVSIYATVTSFFADNTQDRANNTVSFIVAYLIAMAAVIMTGRLLFAFERRPVERSVRRWLMVPDGDDRRAKRAEKPAKSSAAVEPDGEEPAALAV